MKIPIKDDGWHVQSVVPRFCMVLVQTVDVCEIVLGQMSIGYNKASALSQQVSASCTKWSHSPSITVMMRSGFTLLA